MPKRLDLFPMTLEELHQAQQTALIKLVQTAGSPQHLATMLNKPISTVSGWIDRGRISREGAFLVAQHPKLGKEFTVETLRPEIKIN